MVTTQIPLIFTLSKNNKTQAMKKSTLFTLMNLLVGQGLNRKDAYAAAVIQLQELEETPIQIVKAIKADDTETTRVVHRDFSKYQPKGTGRPAPADSILYVDVVKQTLGEKNCIISFKLSRIISVAA